MAAVSRLGVSGFPRGPQTFAPKTAADPFIVIMLIMRRISGDLHYLEWRAAAAGGPYRIYRNGILIDETSGTSIHVHSGSRESVLIEVIADPDGIPIEVNPSRIDLRWAATAATKLYRIEKFVDAAWVTVGSRAEDGSSAYSFRSESLADDTTHEFRVVPVGDNGNDGTPATLDKKVIRHPDAPDVGVTFDDDTQKLRITAL